MSELAPDLATALAAGVVVLDGGLATELERAGFDISGRLWSAELLLSRPEAIVAAHRAYLDAGAQVVTTAGYQASAAGFATVGIDAQGTADLLRRSVQLARQAVTRSRDDEPTLGSARGPAWVAASVGPYGAVLANGSEYTGSYADPSRPGSLDVESLRAFHRPRLEILAAAGADVLALETVPCLREAEALLAEVDRLQVPAWLSLTTVTGDDGVVRTRCGELAAEAFAMAADVPWVIAVGANCTTPTGVGAAVLDAADNCGRPVVVYPNSGETWDGYARQWRGAAALAAADVTEWVAAGARLVGGCCRIGPAEIAQLAALVTAS
jgi:homocysteine S-methyltransferase